MALPPPPWRFLGRKMAYKLNASAGKLLPLANSRGLSRLGIKKRERGREGIPKGSPFQDCNKPHVHVQRDLGGGVSVLHEGRVKIST